MRTRSESTAAELMLYNISVSCCSPSVSVQNSDLPTSWTVQYYYRFFLAFDVTLRVWDNYKLDHDLSPISFQKESLKFRLCHHAEHLPWKPDDSLSKAHNGIVLREAVDLSQIKVVAVENNEIEVAPQRFGNFLVAYQLVSRNFEEAVSCGIAVPLQLCYRLNSLSNFDYPVNVEDVEFFAVDHVRLAQLDVQWSVRAVSTSWNLAVYHGSNLPF